MSGAKKMVPKRRFKEFLNTGDWEQRKLGDVSNIIVGGTPSTKVKAYWEPKEVPWMASGEINKKRIYSTDNMISEYGLNNSNARWVKANSVLIALAGQGKTRGTVAINDIPLTTNQSIAAMELNKDFDAEFIFQNLNSRYEELRRVSSGDGTRGGLNKEILSNFVVPYSTIAEQVKVGNFLRTIDNLIIRCQRKLDKLQATKKALLQEMFPEEGQDKPKRRFKGFTDAWEPRKLERLGKIITGNTPSTLKKEYWSTNIDGVVWITPTDINSVKTQCSERLLTEEGASQARIVPANSILVTCIASIGKNTINTVEAAFNQQINALVPYSSNSYFILTMLNNMESDFKHIAGISATAIINKKEFGQLSALLPNIEEQNKIGEFFELIDNNITLHQRKLDKLKNLKQAYLNEMFV